VKGGVVAHLFCPRVNIYDKFTVYDGVSERFPRIFMMRENEASKLAICIVSVDLFVSRQIRSKIWGTVRVIRTMKID
jgi:hypothetical protein